MLALIALLASKPKQLVKSKLNYNFGFALVALLALKFAYVMT